MAVFRFRLDKVLRLRLRAEQESARELGRLLSLQSLIEARIAKMQEGRVDLLERRNELQRGQMEVSRLDQNRYQIMVLDRSLMIAAGQLEDMARQVSAARAHLLERSRDRKLLDKLKERRREEHDEMERRRELREMDERPPPRRDSSLHNPRPSV